MRIQFQSAHSLKIKASLRRDICLRLDEQQEPYPVKLLYNPSRFEISMRLFLLQCKDFVLKKMSQKQLK